MGISAATKNHLARSASATIDFSPLRTYSDRRFLALVARTSGSNKGCGSTTATEAAARLHERIFAPYDLALRGRVLDVGFGVGGGRGVVGHGDHLIVTRHLADLDLEGRLEAHAPVGEIAPEEVIDLATSLAVLEVLE